MIQEREQAALLGAAGVEKDPRDGLDDPLGVRSWPLPGQRRRPVVVREPGTPDWWDGPEDASQSFLRAMGVRLD